jgi:hypothetical protein
MIFFNLKPRSLPWTAFAVALATLFVSAKIAPAFADSDCDPAMSFTAWTSKLGQQFGDGTRDYIFADGYICPDTDKKFQQFLAQNPPKSPNTIVVLNSGGGDVAAGLHMGEIIRQQKMWTQVGMQFPLMIESNENIAAAAVPYLSKPSAPPFPGECASACTLTFMGGIHRTIGYGSNYGVHQFEYSGEIPNPVGTAQIQSAQIVAYLTEMGISADYMVYMVKKSGNDVTDLTMKQLQQLNVVTPHWKTSWQITALSDKSGFFLDGVTTDPWGTHEIAFACAPKTTGAAPSGKALLVTATFSLDPGVRAKAQDLVAAVKEYAISESGWFIPVRLPAPPKPTVDAANRLTVQIGFTNDNVEDLEGTDYLSFAFLFDPNAKLPTPMRLLQFKSNLNGDLLKQFVSTCH